MATGKLIFPKPPDKDTQHLERGGLVRILSELKNGKMDYWRDSSSNWKRHTGADVGGDAQVFRECGPTDESGYL